MSSVARLKLFSLKICSQIKIYKFYLDKKGNG